MNAPFEDVLVAALGALEQDGPPGVERVLAAHPQHAQRARTHLQRLHGYGLLAPTTQVAVPSKQPVAFPEHLGEFRLLQRLGGGGMGVVYLAEQSSLGRRVALKLVRPEHLYFPGAHDRFRREVEAIAKLQHPGIVPVFAAGEDAGVPWLAMEHVEGASLDEILQSFAGRDPAYLTGHDLEVAVLSIAKARATASAPTRDAATSPKHSDSPFVGPWTSVCLRIVSAIAAALQHAHERGVLHRDVKPSNIMLTLDGRAQLLDFGLALADGSMRLTGTGNQPGSPAYMSPEQMRGDKSRIDARTDVYSLGITLYELLTLRMPFAGDSAASTRDLVLAGHPAPMRLLNRTIPRDVDVLCKKAMDADPGHRYANAAAFGTDLDNVMAKRPITARPPSAYLIGSRWVQRHPARAIAALAAVLLFVVTPTAFLLQQQAKNRDIRAALTNAKQQRDRAREAVDTLLTRVADEDLLELPRMLAVRRDLLDSARTFYERFLAESVDDPELQEETARAALRLWQLEAELGRVEVSVTSAERAEVLARRVLAASPSAKSHALLAEALKAKGSGMQTLARLQPALTNLHEALEHCRTARELAPQDIGSAIDEVAIARAIAIVLAQLGRIEDAVVTYQSIATTWTALDPLTRDTTFRSSAIDQVLCGLADHAYFLASHGRIDELRLVLHQAHAMSIDVGSTALPVSTRLAAARLALTRAKLAAAEKDAPTQEAGYREALAATRSLLLDYPDHANTLRMQATALNDLGLFLDRTEDRGDEALPLYEQSIATLRQLIAIDPKIAENRANLAASLVNLASRLLDANQLQAARTMFVEAADLATAALAESPTRSQWRTVAHNAEWFLGQACGKLGDHVAQATAADRLTTLQPDNPRTLRIASGLLAQSIEALAKDAAWNESDRAPRRRDLETRAMTWLQSAAQLGCIDFKWLSTGPEFASLRSLPGFAEILQQVEANVARAKK